MNGCTGVDKCKFLMAIQSMRFCYIVILVEYDHMLLIKFNSTWKTKSKNKERKKEKKNNWKPLFALISVIILLKQLNPQCNPKMCNRTSCAQVQELP